MKNGNFVVSLDFELYWGVRDVVKLENYQQHLLGVQTVIPRLLQVFQKYNINATFATVGFLFFQNKEELLNHLPEKIPQYYNKNLSPYEGNFEVVGNDETRDPYHFAASLIEQIEAADQEIGSHTFSHYYCLEKGQTKEDFHADIKAAKQIGLLKNIKMKSMVFPRNQFNDEYLKICKEEDFISFRGNENSWLFSSESHGLGLLFRRPFRLLDSYLNLSGHNCYSAADMQKNILINIPSSRFLRPYSKRMKAFENLRLKRIRDSMTYAAENNLTYHLWWHPHNFGINQPENFSFLEKILVHYSRLKKDYDFESKNMRQLAEELLDKTT